MPPLQLLAAPLGLCPAAQALHLAGGNVAARQRSRCSHDSISRAPPHPCSSQVAQMTKLECKGTRCLTGGDMYNKSAFCR